MKKIEWISGVDGIRLDVFVAANCAEISRSRAKTLAASDLIFVNGKPCAKNYRIRKGDRITAEIPPVQDALPEPREMPLDILYEDGDLLVLNKPKGVVVHPAPGHFQDTLVNGLLAHCGNTLSGIRPGIVHRIDKDTSGLLVIAKNDAAHYGLSKQFERHTIDRVYEAVVYGKMSAAEGTIDSSIGRNPADRKKMKTGGNLKRRAVTHYQVLRQYRGFAHIACRLETGRTHQIRVHMASIGHFVLGDTVYGRALPNFKTDFEGQCLHARLLGFDHPSTGEHLVFESPLPDYFEKVLTKLERME